MIRHSCQNPETTTTFSIILPLLRFARFHKSSLRCVLLVWLVLLFPSFLPAVAQFHVLARLCCAPAHFPFFVLT